MNGATEGGEAKLTLWWAGGTREPLVPGMPLREPGLSDLALSLDREAQHSSGRAQLERAVFYSNGNVQNSWRLEMDLQIQHEG